MTLVRSLSCHIGTIWRTTHLVQAGTLAVIPRRTFLPSMPKLPFTSPQKLEYSERRVLGYSMEQMYEIAANVQHYKEFVPFCIDSAVFQQRPGHCLCTLSVGFYNLKETYESSVTLSRPHLVKSESTNSRIFQYLVTYWRISPGPNNKPNTCILDFSVSFQFNSLIYAQAAQLVFDEMTKYMVKSFLKRAKALYGPQSIPKSVQQKQVMKS